MGIWCCIPVDEELDLKKTARAAGEKKVEMVHVKNSQYHWLYTGREVSPIGMKKHFPTYIEEMAQIFDSIMVSAGQRGVQVTLSPQDPGRLCGGKVCTSCVNIEENERVGSLRRTWRKENTVEGNNKIEKIRKLQGTVRLSQAGWEDGQNDLGRQEFMISLCLDFHVLMPPIPAFMCQQPFCAKMGRFTREIISKMRLTAQVSARNGVRLQRQSAKESGNLNPL